jgi:hypothetical protein
VVKSAVRRYRASERTVYALGVLDDDGQDAKYARHRKPYKAQVLGRRFQDISLAEFFFIFLFSFYLFELGAVRGRVQVCTYEVQG